MYILLILDQQYLYSYWNYQLSRSYSVSANCTFSAPHNSNGAKPDKCVGKQENLCTRSDDGNEFCYKSNGDVDNVNHTKPSGLILFNGQKRVMPGRADDALTRLEAMRNCGDLCYEELEMYTSLNAEGPFLGRVKNRIASYTDLGTYIWRNPSCLVLNSVIRHCFGVR